MVDVLSSGTAAHASTSEAEVMRVVYIITVLAFCMGPVLLASGFAYQAVLAAPSSSYPPPAPFLTTSRQIDRQIARQFTSLLHGAAALSPMA